MFGVQLASGRDFAIREGLEGVSGEPGGSSGRSGSCLVSSGDFEDPPSPEIRRRRSSISAESCGVLQALWAGFRTLLDASASMYTRPCSSSSYRRVAFSKVYSRRASPLAPSLAAALWTERRVTDVFTATHARSAHALPIPELRVSSRRSSGLLYS
jgi:hypothetical protein